MVVTIDREKKTGDRALIRDEKTGLMISVPAEKVSEPKEEKEMSPEAREKFDRAWENMRKRIYGK